VQSSPQASPGDGATSRQGGLGGGTLERRGGGGGRRLPTAALFLTIEEACNGWSGVREQGDGEEDGHRRAAKKQGVPQWRLTRKENGWRRFLTGGRGALFKGT
jgi:hypothetical protein